MNRFPKRIVCMTEETVETLYLLGEQDRIVGISGFTVRPPEARKEKPKVSAFTSAKIDKILQLKPDLVLGFSDLQADIATDLIRAGVEVHVFNHRSVAGILNMIQQLGFLVGAVEKTSQLVGELERRVEAVQNAASKQPDKPLVYFEEWYDPIITGIQWVSELIEIAGGGDCFPEHSRQSLGKDRILADPLEVVRRNPDIIIGSWCGRRFRPELVGQRPGWEQVKAVTTKQVFEVKSAIILQPGPAALTDGLDALQDIIERWRQPVST
ncbi:MAG: iron complex transport system substrate-binding protein [Parasphingorhabdus sp.]|jgi:iron complex transport system substrate-binding protein